ncbi:unnamed protein product [Pylaiella littoralis]
MLRFLMYKLQDILPKDEFHRVMAQFSIGYAQQWVEMVKEKLGGCVYEGIKNEFKAEEEASRQLVAEMHCSAKRRGRDRHETRFQVDIGAVKNARVSEQDVEGLLTGYFVGLY